MSRTEFLFLTCNNEIPQVEWQYFMVAQQISQQKTSLNQSFSGPLTGKDQS
jgi:hypothetical protein